MPTLNEAKKVNLQIRTGAADLAISSYNMGAALWAAWSVDPEDNKRVYQVLGYTKWSTYIQQYHSIPARDAKRLRDTYETFYETHWENWDLKNDPGWWKMCLLQPVVEARTINRLMAKAKKMSISDVVNMVDEIMPGVYERIGKQLRFVIQVVFRDPNQKATLEECVRKYAAAKNIGRTPAFYQLVTAGYEAIG